MAYYKVITYDEFAQMFIDRILVTGSTLETPTLANVKNAINSVYYLTGDTHQCVCIDKSRMDGGSWGTNTNNVDMAYFWDTVYNDNSGGMGIKKVLISSPPKTTAAHTSPILLNNVNDKQLLSTNHIGMTGTLFDMKDTMTGLTYSYTGKTLDSVTIDISLQHHNDTAFRTIAYIHSGSTGVRKDTYGVVYCDIPITDGNANSLTWKITVSAYYSNKKCNILANYIKLNGVQYNLTVNSSNDTYASLSTTVGGKSISNMLALETIDLNLNLSDVTTTTTTTFDIHRARIDVWHSNTSSMAIWYLTGDTYNPAGWSSQDGESVSMSFYAGTTATAGLSITFTGTSSALMYSVSTAQLQATLTNNTVYWVRFPLTYNSTSYYFWAQVKYLNNKLTLEDALTYMEIIPPGSSQKGYVQGVSNVGNISFYNPNEDASRNKTYYANFYLSDINRAVLDHIWVRFGRNGYFKSYINNQATLLSLNNISTDAYSEVPLIDSSNIPNWTQLRNIIGSSSGGLQYILTINK